MTRSISTHRKNRTRSRVTTVATPMSESSQYERECPADERDRDPVSRLEPVSPADRARVDPGAHRATGRLGPLPGGFAPGLSKNPPRPYVSHYTSTSTCTHDDQCRRSLRGRDPAVAPRGHDQRHRHNRACRHL